MYFSMKNILSLAIISFLVLPAFSYAAVQSNDGSTGVQSNDGSTGVQSNDGGAVIPNPLGDITLTGLFETLLEILLIFAIPIVAFFIIYAGFLYVTARGNTETITKAHRALLYAVIGGVLILGGNVLIEVIGGTVDSITN